MVNIGEVQPTILFSVPRIFEKAYNRILEAVDSGPPAKKRLFYWAFQAGSRYYEAVWSTATATQTVAPCSITFTDVLPTDYFYEPVRYLYCNAVISGYNDNTFRPYNNTTRGQLTKIVVLGFGFDIYTPPAPTFTDVPVDHPFYAFVETAYREGLVSGYDDGTFRPYNNVTRGQLSKIVVQAARWPPYRPASPTFSDVPAGHPFYLFVETAYEHAIISGYADGTFRPGNGATRGQISKIVFLALT
jgi:hypothetical protein